MARRFIGYALGPPSRPRAIIPAVLAENYKTAGMAPCTKKPRCAGLSSQEKTLLNRNCHLLAIHWRTIFCTRITPQCVCSCESWSVCYRATRSITTRTLRDVQRSIISKTLYVASSAIVRDVIVREIGIPRECHGLTRLY